MKSTNIYAIQPHIVGNERREVDVAQRAGAAIRHEHWAAAYLILR
jgi:hypothetical protein